MEKGETRTSDRAEEARHLAEEAKEEAKSGNRDEAAFIAEEARKLDPEAAGSVLDGRKI